MDINQMLAEVEQQIAKLQRVADALRGTESKQSTSPSRGRGLSAAARRKISLAQKARWANQKSGPQPTESKRTISAASRRKMAAAQKARWAKVKAQQKKAA
jgi:hypothetical protein